MSQSLLVLSRDHVASITKTISAEALCTMLGKTMHYISRDSNGPHDPSNGPAPIQNPLRISTEGTDHKTLYMPSRLTTGSNAPSATAIKVVAVPKPACKVPGLPATTLLFDEETGKCRAVVNADELTGLRTAAASALATRLLASPQAEQLLVFGSGTQAYYHARLILELFPSISRVTCIVRRITERATALAERLQNEFVKVGVDVATEQATSVLVQSADIICCCVPSTEPVFDAQDLKSTVHINAIGSYTPKMQEFPPSLISRWTPGCDPGAPNIPFILVDSRSACLSEAGELIAAGIAPESCIELGDVVDKDGQLSFAADEKMRSLRKRGRTLFKAVGVGGMDVAIARAVVEAAEEQGFGSRVPF